MEVTGALRCLGEVLFVGLERVLPFVGLVEVGGHAALACGSVERRCKGRMQALVGGVALCASE